MNAANPVDAIDKTGDADGGRVNGRHYQHD